MKKISLFQKTKKLWIWSMILAFIISFIAFLAFLDLEIKDRILFSLVFSIMISLIIITIYYLLGILLFLKMALYFTEKYNDKKNGYVIIFIPMILFFIARIFDWNTFLDKLFLNFYLFSGLIILDVICPLVNFYLFKKIISEN